MSLTALAIALSLAASTVMAAPRSQYQWEKRILVLLGENRGSDLDRQEEILRQAVEGLADRDMLLLSLQGDRTETLFGAAAELDAQAVRESIGWDGSAFQAVLIGKDGGVKQRWPQPVSVEELFAVIDAMPMRANEMRQSEK